MSNLQKTLNKLKLAKVAFLRIFLSLGIAIAFGCKNNNSSSGDAPPAEAPEVILVNTSAQKPELEKKIESAIDEHFAKFPVTIHENSMDQAKKVIQSACGYSLNPVQYAEKLGQLNSALQFVSKGSFKIIFSGYLQATIDRPQYRLHFKRFTTAVNFMQKKGYSIDPSTSIVVVEKFPFEEEGNTKPLGLAPIFKQYSRSFETIGLEDTELCSNKIIPSRFKVRSPELPSLVSKLTRLIFGSENAIYLSTDVGQVTQSFPWLEQAFLAHELGHIHLGLTNAEIESKTNFLKIKDAIEEVRKNLNIVDIQRAVFNAKVVERTYRINPESPCYYAANSEEAFKNCRENHFIRNPDLTPKDEILENFQSRVRYYADSSELFSYKLQFEFIRNSAGVSWQEYQRAQAKLDEVMHVVREKAYLIGDAQTRFHYLLYHKPDFTWAEYAKLPPFIE